MYVCEMQGGNLKGQLCLYMVRGQRVQGQRDQVRSHQMLTDVERRAFHSFIV